MNRYRRARRLPYHRPALSNEKHRTPPIGGTIMQWTTPAYTDLRFGFEITMYIATR
jgi:coenzyme PQQ precursor peptide PqqA